MDKCQFGLALECLHHAQDFGGLLLLATSAGDAGTVQKLGDMATKEGQNNVAFMANFLLGRYVGWSLASSPYLQFFPLPSLPSSLAPSPIT